MIIKEIKTNNYGRLQNREIQLSEGLNVFYGKRKNEKMAVHEFVEDMLYGMSGDGILRFESKGKSFRLGREAGESPEEKEPHSPGELFCETSGEILNASQDKLDDVLGEAGEAVYRTAVYARTLKAATTADAAREVQEYMLTLEETGDRGLDLGRTEQMLKMSRKGYQVQTDRHERDIQKEKEKLSFRADKLNREIQDLEEEKQSIVRQEESFHMTEGDNGEELLNEKVRKLETRSKIQATAMVLTVLAAFTLAVFCAMSLRSEVLSMVSGVSGLVLFLIEMNLEMKTARELEKQRRLRKRWLARRQKLRENKQELEDAQLEKTTEIFNVKEEQGEIDRKSCIPCAEELELQAVNLAMETLNKLRAGRKLRTGETLCTRASEILNEITEGKISEIVPDGVTHISIRNEEEIHPLENQSRSTVELVYFAVYMASGEILAEPVRLPVVLNEFFGMYGQDQFIAVIKWLVNCGRQIILHSSQQIELELLDKAGVSYNRIDFE